jgi:activator of HSP90 ATPase
MARLPVADPVAAAVARLEAAYGPRTPTSGGAVQITATPGTEWSAFGGRIHGRLLALTPDHEIVQSWRSFEWQEGDPDSTLILTFWPEATGSRVELTQQNVPDRLYENLVVGWPNRYWNPWRAYLEGPRPEARFVSRFR